MVEYNPIDKSSKLNKYIDIPNIEGDVRFIGTRDNEPFFINWKSGKSKGVYDFKILAINNQNEVRICSSFERNFGKKGVKLLGPEYISHFGNMDEFNSLYFTINWFSKSEKKGNIILDYEICKFSASADLSSISFGFDTYYGMDGVAHPNVYCFPENQENTSFYLNSGGVGWLTSTSFDGSKIQPETFDIPSTPSIYFYKDEFPVLFEVAMKYPNGKGVFKICEDGFARLIIITEKAECFLFKEATK